MIHFHSIPREVLAVMAAFVTLCLGAERIGRFGDLWWIYRLTAEALETEEQMFIQAAGPYAVIDGLRTSLLVERCERILTREAESWKHTVRGSGSEDRPSVLME
jgi:hypothetical protein